MSTAGGDNFQGRKHIEREKRLIQNTIEILDGEKESILIEILSCNVCFELPEGKHVKICEEGHHFCSSCHKEMKVCGICRGKLLETRNFAVEQLVTKLAPVLGISRKLPPAEPPANLTPGSYKCLHECPCKLPAHKMLQHLRDKHSSNLVDNVRSNPYSGRFSFIYKLVLGLNNKYILSTHVSDMGLFTVELTFTDLNLFSCVRVLGDKTVSSMFKYSLSVRIPNKDSESLLEFSITDCPVSSYLDVSEAKGLQLRGDALHECVSPETEISVYFSIWKKNEKEEKRKNSLPSVICRPESNLFFQSNRKSRRNSNRNMRRKRLKEKLKNLAESEEALLEGMFTLGF